MSNNFENRKSVKRKKKKVSTKKKLLITVGILLLFFVGIGISAISYGYSLLNKVDKVEIDEHNLGINEEINNKLSQYKNIKNIALFGVDSTDGGVGRSDSIMVLTIDTDRNKLKVSSLMRDSYVDIKNNKIDKMDKLNHAYAFGGPELAIKTINENFGLNITDFVSVNFSNLPKIIDKIGGLDLTITTEELKYINDYIDDLNWNNKTNSPHITTSGLQHVNGTQALAYSRIRYTSGGDYERTQRHRTLLTALFEKFKSTSPTNYTSLLNELLPMIQTNLSPNEILGLATNVVKMGNINLDQDRFPRDGYCEGKTINEIYYLIYNKDATIQQIHDYIFDDIK